MNFDVEIHVMKAPVDLFSAFQVALSRCQPDPEKIIVNLPCYPSAGDIVFHGERKIEIMKKVFKDGEVVVLATEKENVG